MPRRLRAAATDRCWGPQSGGIIDDTMVTKRADDFYQVVNAGCADKDLAHLDARLGQFGGDVHMAVHWEDRGLFALQGPEV